jgi:hypothetical protein
MRKSGRNKVLKAQRSIELNELPAKVSFDWCAQTIATLYLVDPLIISVSLILLSIGRPMALA